MWDALEYPTWDIEKGDILISEAHHQRIQPVVLIPLSWNTIRLSLKSQAHKQKIFRRT